MSANKLSPLARLLSLISLNAANPNISFENKAIAIREFSRALNDDELKYLLGEAGFIPEGYEIDSSEEKVYAKAMDILVAEALTRLGYRCGVSEERSNSADVVAACVDGKSHTLVLDAKAFRLSRTALNPKDYKIEALNTWRKAANFASLVAPLAGYPQGNSRLYREAITFNVTLVTFSHLQFLLEHGVPTDALYRLWDISAELKNRLPANPSAEEYWAELDRVFCEVLNVTMNEWKAARDKYFTAMLAVADEQIAYFELRKKEVEAMSREELIPLAIDVLGLEQKITVIRKKKRMAIGLLKAIEAAE